MQPSYVDRINRAIDHVLAHLGSPVRLDEVAAVAGLSPFHFHRIFHHSTGESLARFVTRLRLERALRLLIHDRSAMVGEVALSCGFASASHFIHAFKRRYGQAPGRFDREAWRAERREELTRSMAESGSGYRLDRLPAGENPDGFVTQIRQLPPRKVAYVRVFEPFRPGRVEQAAARLQAWALERGLADGQWLGYMWDDPDCVPLSDCRYDVGLQVPEGVGSEGEIGLIEFPSMSIACLPVRGDISLEQRALDWLFGTWLPASGRVPADQPVFEAWVGRPFAFGTAHFELDLHLPLRSTRLV